MKIAVPFENENVYAHFGHTSTFKIYEIEGGRITTVRIMPTLGSGHGALAGFLGANNVDTLICGGIGGGAIDALAGVGIRVYAGVSGNADVAVHEFLDGKLKYSEGANCDHHHGEDHKCGDHGCGNEGHSCGNCHSK